VVKVRISWYVNTIVNIGSVFLVDEALDVPAMARWEPLFSKVLGLPSRKAVRLLNHDR
jgi:hypothetical protein